MTIPPTLPDPEAEDQMMFGSVGSGVAQPLSPPPTECHPSRGITPPPPPPPPKPPILLFAGPRDDGPSWRWPIPSSGISLSTGAGYICAIGSCTRSQVRPRRCDIATWPLMAPILGLP